MPNKSRQTAAKRTSVVIKIDDDHRADAKNIVQNLGKAGFEADQLLEAIGVVTGTVPGRSLAKLRKIEGVADVEEERADYRPQ